MQRLIRLNCFLYAQLLIFYPRELRRRFGKHMVEIFEDLLRDLPLRGNTTAFFSLWRTALWELASVGIVWRLQNTALIAAAASILLSSLLAWMFFRAVGA